MAERSYIGIDYEHVEFCAVTLNIYLVYIYDKPQVFLNERREKLTSLII